MRVVSVELVALLVVAPIACASTTEQRRDYILAHSHGWVEVSVEDHGIPQVPAPAGTSASLVRPDSCSVEVLLDREPFVAASAYPTGDAPPYSVKTGFRFPAAAGAAHVQVSYSDCRLVLGKAATITAETEITIEAGRVTELQFDGIQLRALAPRDDSAVTLEDIYEAVTGKPKPAR